MTRIVHTRNGEAYTFRLYWLVTKRQLENAKRNEVGSINDLMPALAFAAFTVEAYVNFIGSKLLPKLWKNERNLGFEKKLKKIFEELGQQFPDCSVDPYSSILSLKNLRDELAHGKPYVVDDSFETDEDTTSANYRELFFKIPLYEKLTLSGLEGAETTISQAEAFINLIHSYALDRLQDVPHLKPNALAGVLSFCSYSDRLSA